MLVAELAGQPAGTVSMGGHGSQSPGSLRMFALDVGATFRGHGIGAALIEAVEDEARRNGLKRVNLKVALGNVDADCLDEWLRYRRCGEPVIDRWTRSVGDGDIKQGEISYWVMIRGLQGSSKG